MLRINGRSCLFIKKSAGIKNSGIDIIELEMYYNIVMKTRFKNVKNHFWEGSKMDRSLKRYTIGEEIFNSVSHGVGSLLSVIGTVVLVVMAAYQHSPLALATSLIYGLSLIVLYTMSTVYHAVQPPRAKEILRIFDHASIFMVIACSYKPFCLIALQGNFRGLVVVAAVWLCALTGIVLNAIDLKKTERLGTVLYVIMGWSVLAVFKDILSALPEPAFWLLLLGGISYTGGLVFYAMKNTKYMHSIWHLFVLLGSVLHYLCIAVYVMPMAF